MSTAPSTLPAPAESGDERTPESAAKTTAATRTQLRGSTLLLVGRFVSLGINFVTQVLIARYLTKNEFGIFAYGLSMVALGEAISTMGLDKGVARWLPIYDEQGTYNRLFGTLFMVTGTVIGFGAAFIAVAFGLDGFAGGKMAASPGAVTVLLILICLAPLQSLDDVLMGVFAVFSKPRAIFVRRYVLAPMFRLGAIVFVLATHAGVKELAIGYVLGGAAGIVLYLVMLVGLLRKDGLMEHLHLRRLEFPWREVYGFALPLVVVDLLFVVMNTTNVFMLEMFGNTNEVADYRVVQPAAKLNSLVMTSFALLFTPAASRLFARGDKKGINDLYWSTAVWIAVFSFPVFALTFPAAKAVTVALFGAQYASSAPILALLSLGYYFNAALGFNGLTLRVYGMVKLTVGVSLFVAVLNVLVNLALIPAFGAVGAGVGTCVTLLLHNVIKQLALRRGTGISVFDRRQVRVYGSIVLATVVIGLVALLLNPSVYIQVALSAVVSALVIRLNRAELRVEHTFPEIARLPILRRLLT
ncbi:flippase [Baekduia soli]|uniref:Flippase n=1 Tax=Baekduia soli TaxID=496014 RepID=A0A5B8U864_9ACTN|nr:flippase [Baekduia soli]QEC49135.1 flippase [Baekduia soli]